uniref:Ephrin-A2b n=1 Tax=Sinocyclocheilus rhinocerous TaxID=307959 RepID=A0A673GGQ7_9TELE
MELTLFMVVLLFWVTVCADDSKIISDRYGVYWNSTNPRFLHGEYTVEVAINDYLDIYCPHYEDHHPQERMERYILFMVNYDGYTTCNHHMKGFKRSNSFSHFQLFTPFSLGFEFRPGHEYYYISSPHPNLGGKPCLKLKVYVKPTSKYIPVSALCPFMLFVNLDQS